MILLGLDYPITEKIKWAESIFKTHRELLLHNDTISNILKIYREKIDNTWRIMRETGICNICTRCALLEGGSCCGDGIEDKFDALLLLINLLFGYKLPLKREIENGCWFLGEKGCKLIARQVICVNYLCKKIYNEVEPEQIHRLQRAILDETEQLFIVEEKMKSELLKLGI